MHDAETPGLDRGELLDRPLDLVVRWLHAMSQMNRLRWLLMAMAAGGCTSMPAYVRVETQATARLHAMLEVPEAEALRVVRDYSPLYYDNLTFYRASVREPGVHTRIRRAAIVEMEGELFPVASEADLGRLWSSVGRPFESPDDGASMWTELLWSTAVIGDADVLYSADSFDVGYRAFLEPKNRLDDIAPPIWQSRDWFPRTRVLHRLGRGRLQS